MEMKNAPTSAATLTGTVDSGAVCKAAQASANEFTTFGGSCQAFRVADLLRKLGYQRVQVTPGSGDQGVDVLAEKDGIKYAFQCKCYSSDLGNKPVQEVHAGKYIYQCHVGVVITNRYFTQGAKDAAKATGILLWDRDKLQSMIEAVS